MGTLPKPYLLAFDTANEAIAIGIGRLDPHLRAIVPVAAWGMPAHRESNTKLLAAVDSLMAEQGIRKSEIACVVCGRGPGSFTGVRICMATAKGIASAWEVPLQGVSSLDAVAWQVWAKGVRGQGAVCADAMRKEVYPVRFEVNEGGALRLEADSVAKAQGAADRLAGHANKAGTDAWWLAGDALHKYGELFVSAGIPETSFVESGCWVPTGEGLLLAAQAAWQSGAMDPFDRQGGDPSRVLPVYTRLSDAEENERIRLAQNSPKDLHTGVQAAGIRRDQRPCTHDSAIENARPDERGIVFRPLDAANAAAAAALDAAVMAADAWSEALVLDDLLRSDRIWWAAYEPCEQASEATSCPSGPAVRPTARLVAFAGGWVVDGQLQILKVAVSPLYRRAGIARTLLAKLAADARDLGAHKASLEVRRSNAGAQALYEACGLAAIGVRPRYYADGEDAVIREGLLPLARGDVAGMALSHSQECCPVPLSAQAPTATLAAAQAPAVYSSVQGLAAQGLASSPTPVHSPTAQDPAVHSPTSQAPLILAIETSCDETAAAIIDGQGILRSDVVASQIDFHARFGGVVPEIASRKHIEAICGVTQECLDVAAQRLGRARLQWRDLSAVAVTFAPGLVGALVVGLAFAKGAAWAADIPLIGVNHLEGHIYANKLATPDIAPPMVVALLSGGHTMLVQVKAWGEYETLGSTLDDAVGEAFDKVAKAMGLGYPGGPAISKLATQGDPRAIDFPRAMLHSGDLRFSLSGLKTAVITYLHQEEAAGRRPNKADVAASFQQAVIDVQVAKAKQALALTGAKEFCLGGGVAANPALRAAYEKMCADMGVRLTLPPLHACTDNAGMIALVAFDRFQKRAFFGLEADAHAHASLDEPY
ncbi:MAG: tRNA (adenosine(37)-N6)-threonylcarbamoyltransferase complex transferase subunit TsaD [Coriobacteriaceae bacterium]|jgi:N6-L-threonylcarbamoyladenine synthase|nr:tRNA (adenosine(37)-N6)-threonylcarbamoyltransferase complex transferase subunit TsaD [Coriobacteriaceae bacterium]